MGLLGDIIDDIFFNDDDLNTEIETEIEKINNNYYAEVWGKYSTLYDDESDLSEKISIMKKVIAECDDEAWPVGLALDNISYCYYELEDYDKALEYNIRAIKSDSVEEGSKLYGNLFHFNLMLKELIDENAYDDIEAISNLRSIALTAYNYSDDEELFITTQDGQELTRKQDAWNEFKILNSCYTDHFLDLQYKDRKALLIVDSFVDLSQDHFTTLHIDSDLSSLTFPIGHPKVNEVYVAHPLTTNRYMPIESYQLELVEDRVREFCELVQGLGATEINIDCHNSNSNDSGNSGNQNLSGGVSLGKNSIHGSKHDEYSRRLIEEIGQSISLHQTFQPHKVPALPNNLVWYEGEPSWQRLYRQRMDGGLLTHEERIETKKSQVVDNREMKEIKGELQSLFADLDIAFDKTEEAKFEQQENAVLAISVKFAPLSQLTENSTSTPSSKMFSANEQKYIDEVKECLADGEITKTGRRLLKMHRDRLGISESRAAELEASVAAPQLSDEEKEYLEAYQEANENGQISDKERRTLNRLRDALGISEERAKEIEQLIR